MFHTVLRRTRTLWIGTWLVGIDLDADIAEELGSENVGAVVIAEDDEPVGIVLDRDIVVALTDHDDVDSLADEVMSADPVTLRADEEERKCRGRSVNTVSTAFRSSTTGS